ncbi:MAG: tandem-95 repeat protein [Alphaproteobacteria bacterium]|nr:MAG: tandem-95 repeat protein [Alphaproteobacteria bacterium]
MDNKLFQAILAMDSYNRSYGEGVILTGTSVGTATILTDSEIFGNVEGSDIRKDANIGFYAIAYQYDGQTTIAYRGTDDLYWKNILLNFDLSLDQEHGWPVGAGFPDTDQSEMAFSFYRYIASQLPGGTFEDPFAPNNITVTGHSLGGGIAGLVAAIYSKDGYLFDSMAYKESADLLQSAKQAFEAGPLSWAEFVLQHPLAAPSTSFLETVYGSEGLFLPSDPLSYLANTASINGQGLDTIQTTFHLAPNPDESYTLGPDITYDFLNPISPEIDRFDLHNVGTLVIRMFAGTTAAEEAAFGTDWMGAAKYFWPVLYDVGFAKDIGMNTIQGRYSQEPEAGDAHTYDTVLRTIIAYSAIDEGTRIFGDTGIRALYDDAGDFGTALYFSDDSSPLVTFARDISEAFVQFAGQMAMKQVTSDTHFEVLSGVLSYSDVSDNHTLTINFSDDLWKTGSGSLPPMVARADIVEDLELDSQYTFQIAQGTQALWGGTDEGPGPFLTPTSIFSSVVFQTGVGGNVVISPLLDADHHVDLTHEVFFVGSNGDDTITGSSGNELILTEDGIDTVYGSGGSDVIAGNDSATVDYRKLLGGVTVTEFIDGFGVKMWSVDKSDVRGTSGDPENTLDSEFGRDLVMGVYNLIGGSGDDKFYSFGDGNNYDGSGGFNAADYSKLDGGTTVVHNNGNLLVSADTLENFQQVTLTQGDDFVSLFDGRGLDEDLKFIGGGGVDRAFLSADDPVIYNKNTGTVYNIDGTGFYQFKDFTSVTLPIANWTLPSYAASGSGADFSAAGSKGTFVIDFPDAGGPNSSLNAAVAGKSYSIEGGAGPLYGDNDFQAGIAGTNHHDTFLVGILPLNLSPQILLGNQGADIVFTHFANDPTYSITTFNPDPNGGPNIVQENALFVPDARFLNVVYTGGNVNISSTVTGYINDGPMTTAMPDPVANSLFSFGGVTMGDGITADMVTVSFSDVTFPGDAYFPPPERGNWSIQLIEFDVTITVAGLGQITVTNDLEQRPFDSAWPAFSVGFADGTSRSWYGDGTSTELVIGVQHEYRGHFGNDTLTSAGNYDTTLWGYGGNDTLTGKTGSDTVYAGSGDDRVIGAAGNDALYGNDGNDVVLGGDGDDILAGGAGNDTLDSGTGTNTLTGGTGADAFNVVSGDMVTDYNPAEGDVIHKSGASAEDITVQRVDGDLYVGDPIILQNFFTNGGGQLVVDFGGDEGTGVFTIDDAGVILSFVTGVATWGGDIISGTTGNDTIDSLGGDDRITGLAGDDTLTGGTGSDTYNFADGDGQDTVIDLSGALDTVKFDATVSVSSVSYARDGGDLAINYGSGDDSITVQGFFFSTGGTIEQVAFDDATVHDLAYIAAQAGAIIGTDAADELTGTSGDDIVLGLSGSDSLTGFAGNDILNGGLDGDQMAGGAGDDTYLVDNATDFITEDVDAGIDLVLASASFTLNDNVENITLTGTEDIDATGNALDNALTGNSGANDLDGGTGADTMTGGLGNDRYYVDDAGDSIVEDADGGTDSIVTGFSYILPDVIENLFLTGDEVLSGTGNDHDNILASNGAGNSLAGGLGNDVYYVSSVDDVVTEGLDAGRDTVAVSFSYTLGENLENLTLTGDQDLTGIGNAFDNIITGNAGNDTLDGGEGNDIISTGTGDNLVIIGANAGDDVVNGGDGNVFVDFTADTAFDTHTQLNTGNSYGEVWLPTFGSPQVMHVSEGDVTSITFDGFSGSITSDGLSAVLLGGDDLTIIFDTAASNLVYGGTGNNTYIGSASGDYIDGGDGNSTMYGNDGGDVLRSGNATNALFGGAGDDYIYDNGYVTSDTYDGGAGFDTLDYNSVFANVVATISGGVISSAQTGNDTISGIDDIYFGFGNDTITGDATTVLVLHGGSGNDILTTGDMGDALFGDSGNDTLTGGAGFDTLTGGLGNDKIFAGDGDDVVNETDGGNDTINGGAGVDILDYSSVGSPMALNVTATQVSSTVIGTDVISGVEAVRGGMASDGISGSGTVAIDLYGGEGGDIMNVFSTGGVGWRLYGETGDDSLTGDTGNDTLDGGANNDVLFGGAGNDILDGGAGNDAMSGGAGNDTFFVDNAGDQVNESAGAGIDTVLSSVTFDITLFGNVEHLTLTGSDAINGTGNSQNNVMTGNSAANTLNSDGGSDTLNGGAGADLMIGGTGSDTYFVDNALDVVTEVSETGVIDTVFSSVTYSIATFSGVENLTLTGTGDINGTGNSASGNIITGNSGNNTLDGGIGADTMTGGAGNDVYICESSTDVVNEGLNGGIDEIRTSGGHALSTNVENLTLTGTLNINGLGNTLNNIIIGNSGNNLMAGNGGLDTLAGGLGNDTYSVNTTDVIIEGADEGIDLMQAFGNLTLVDHVENLLLQGTGNINGTGNTLGNVITGNAGNNVLNGAAGMDTVNGGLGNDTYLFRDGDGQDVISDTGGNDTFKFDGSVDSDSVTYTQSGNDLIIHYGAGTDQITVTGYYDVSGAGLIEQFIFNQPPVAQHDAFSTNEDTPVIGNVLANNGSGVDSDPDGDALSVAAGSVATAQGGTVNLSADGSFTYTPAADYNGADSFNYTLLDIWGNSANGTVDITLAPVNDAPVAKDDGFSVDGGAVLAGNVLADNGSGVDNDVDGDTLSVTAATFATANGGAVELFANGSFTYTPATGFSGADSFDYTLLDGHGGSDTGTVNIAVGGGANTPPVAQDDAITAAWGTALTGNLLADNGSGADTDPDNDTLQVVESSVTTAGGFVIGLAANGSFSFTPPADFLGSDSFSYTVSDGHGGTDTANVTLNVTAPAGAIVGTSGADVLAGTGSNNLVFALGGDDTVTASGGSDTVFGGSGNDTLDGGSGSDMLSGGSGNDTYVVNGTGDLVTENLDAGADTVLSSISYTLTPNIENLTLTGINNIRGTGNALDNMITGNSGNNSLDGGLGADTMAGGLGNDTYILDNAGDSITENPDEGIDTVKAGFSYVLGATFENLTLTGTGNFDATGNDANNIILGNAGDNIIDGGTGADTMKGGAGNDTYYVDNSSDVVTDSGGIDTVIASASFTLGSGVENLTLVGDGEINGGGNGLANTLTGNNKNNILTGSSGIDTIYALDGNDTLDGGGGADTLFGGKGDDTYIINSAAENLSEDDGNGGHDTVLSSATWTLGSGFEDLILTGIGNIKGFGNADENVITGNSGNNSLDGGGGQDTLAGGLGDDTYIIGNTGVTITELSGEGTDTVKTSISYTLGDNLENLTLTGTSVIDGTGNGANNVITGNSAANTLSGLGGDDTLTGGGAADLLQGGDNNDTVFGNGGADTIDGGVGDDIMFGQGGADTLTGGLGADTFAFQAASAYGSVDKINDFSTGDGDRLDISDLLAAYDPLTMPLSDFVHLTESAGNTTLAVDRDGTGTGFGFTNIVTLNGVTGLPDVDTMVVNGNLVVT